MSSDKRALLSLASGLGIFALVGGFAVAPSEASGLMPEAKTASVSHLAPYVSANDPENRKQNDPLSVASGYTLQIDAVHDRIDERIAAEEAAQEAREAERAAAAEAAARQSQRSTSTTTTTSTSGDSVWDRLAECESSGNWAINSGNGYYGGLQFSLSTWRSVGGSGYPHEASREEQIQRAEILRDTNGGYGAWPSCSAQLGL